MILTELWPLDIYAGCVRFNTYRRYLSDFWYQEPILYNFRRRRGRPRAPGSRNGHTVTALRQVHLPWACATPAAPTFGVGEGNKIHKRPTSSLSQDKALDAQKPPQGQSHTDATTGHQRVQSAEPEAISWAICGQASVNQLRLPWWGSPATSDVSGVGCEATLCAGGVAGGAC